MRIISTLKEDADDFIVKQEAEKNKPAVAKKEIVKKDAPKTDATVKEEKKAEPHA